MASTRKLTVEIVGDARDLGRAFGAADDQAGRFGRTVGRAGLAVAGGLAAAGAAALVLAPQILDAGAELEALGVKAQTVFGDQLPTVTGWADEVAGSMGLTSAEATGLAANLGDLLKPMGFTAAEAAGMSTDLLDLSGALSAWSGGTVDAAGVSEILTKALLGERDGLKQLGISISEADVDARLAAKGQDKLTGAALAQAKALATQELIMEKSTDAQDAWADGTMDGIKAQNEARAEVERLKESLVRVLYPALTKLIPVLADVATWLADNLPGAMAAVQDALEDAQDAFEGTRDVITDVIDTVEPYITGFIDGAIRAWEMFGDEILGVVEATWNTVAAIFEGAFAIFYGIFETFAGLFTGDWQRMWDGIRTSLEGAWILIQGIVQGAIDTVWAIVSDGMTNLVNAVSGGINDAVAWFAELPFRIGFALWGLADTLWDIGWGALTGFLDGVKNAYLSVLSWFFGLPGGLASAIGDLGSTLWGKGADLIQGLWDGAISVWNDFVNWLGGLDFNPFGAATFERPDTGKPPGSTGGGGFALDDFGGGRRTGATTWMAPIQLVVGTRVVAEELIAYSLDEGGLNIRIREYA